MSEIKSNINRTSAINRQNNRQVGIFTKYTMQIGNLQMQTVGHTQKTKRADKNKSKWMRRSRNTNHNQAIDLTSHNNSFTS